MKPALTAQQEWAKEGKRTVVKAEAGRKAGKAGKAAGKAKAAGKKAATTKTDPAPRTSTAESSPPSTSVEFERVVKLYNAGRFFEASQDPHVRLLLAHPDIFPMLTPPPQQLDPDF